MKSMLWIVLLALPMAASARVHQLWECHLNEGKTLQDAFDVMKAARDYEKEQGVPLYEAGIMAPWHGNSDLPPGAFVAYAILDDFKAMGATLGSLWDEGKGYASPHSTNDVYTCTTNIRLFWEPNDMRLE